MFEQILEYVLSSSTALVVAIVVTSALAAYPVFWSALYIRLPNKRKNHEFDWCGRREKKFNPFRMRWAWGRQCHNTNAFGDILGSKWVWERN